MKKIRYILISLHLVLLLLGGISSLHAQCVDNTGLIAFTGYQIADAGNPQGQSDRFSFVTLDSIPPNTPIRFTDRGFTGGSSFQDFGNALTDGDFSWSDASGISPGTHIVVTLGSGTATSTIGSITGYLGNFNLGLSGDQIFAYTASPSFKIHAAMLINKSAWDTEMLELGNPIVTSSKSLNPAIAPVRQSITVYNSTDDAFQAKLNPITLTGSRTALRNQLFAGIFNIANSLNTDAVNLSVSPLTWNASVPTYTPISLNNKILSSTVTDACYIQWQSSIDGINFSNINDGTAFSGTKTASLTINTPLVADTWFRMHLTGAAYTVTDAIKLTLPAVTAHPLNRSICVGENTSFSVTATGTDLQYQWQEDRGSGFTDLSDGGVYSGVTTSTLNISGATAGMDGYQYRVRVYSSIANPVTSNSATLSVSNIQATISKTDVGCFGEASGSATVSNVMGGIGSYTYSWVRQGTTDIISDTETASGLTEGTYTVTIRDAIGCVKTLDVIIMQPSALTASTTQTNVSCFNGSNGTATVSVSGGTGPYTYSWLPSGGTSQTATGLSAGTYTVTVTDANSCQITRSFTITHPPALMASDGGKTNVSCNGGSNGTATVNVVGGTGAYTYTYSWAPFGGTSQTATGLSAGLYTVTVTDANGCQTTQNFEISEPTSAVVITTSDIMHVSTVGGSDGSATVDVMGGTAPYTYSWSPTGGTGATATGLSAGVYTVTVTDANTCTYSHNVTIEQQAVNQAPVISNLNGDAVTFTEDGPAVLLDVFGNATVSDPDSPDFNEGNLTVSIVTNGVAAEDRLGIRHEGSGPGLIDVAGGDVYYGGTPIGSLTGGIAGQDLVVTFLPNSTPAAAQALIRNLTYSNVNTGNPSSAPRTVYITLSDGDGGTSAVQAVTVSIKTVNDAPTISVPVQINVTEDVPVALTGITFYDVDNTDVTVTFRTTIAGAGSGTLTATSTADVTVSGSGTNELTMAGPWASINNLIAANGLVFLTDQDNVNTVFLNIQVSDGALADSTATSLIVAAVNDAPQISVPLLQTVLQDATLTFNAANGNPISISDVDAGTNPIKLNLTTTRGLLSLGSTNGLSFDIGNGTADNTMEFTGTLADINAALNGLAFEPTGGYYGPAAINITADDQGATGAGGPKSVTREIPITVEPLNPKVTSVSASTADGLYKADDVITLTVTFNQNVVVNTNGGDTPTLLLETGIIDRSAIYMGGSGSNTLTFIYTVQPGDVSADLDYVSISALSLNGATILSSYNGANAVLTLPTVGGASSIAGQKNIVIDGIVPVVNAVAVPANAYYGSGDQLYFTVEFSEAVAVNTTGGSPALSLTIGSQTVSAQYLTESSTTTDLLFRYSVAAGMQDHDGIEIGTLSLNGATIRDAAGNDAVLTLNNVGATTHVKVDAKSPVVTMTINGGATHTNDRNVTLTLTTADTDVATMSFMNSPIFFPGSGASQPEPFAPTKAWQLTAGDGMKFVSGIVIDGAGNLTSVLAVITLDQTAPIVTGVDEGESYNTDRTITFNEGTATLNGATFISGTTVSQDGAYTLIVTDEAGNSTTLSFAIDQTAPAVPAGLTATPDAGNINLQWTANQEADLAAYRLYSGTAADQLSVLADIPAGTTTYTHGPLTMGQRYYYAITAIDALGNESAQSVVVDALPQDTQTITFGTLNDMTYGDAPFALTATTTSGLTVAYSSSDNSIASIAGDVLTIHQAGDVVITASQNGNNAFLAATPVTQALHINKADFAGITFDDKTVTYDGSAHSIFVSNAPTDATVIYTNNNQINAGTYTVMATVSQANYNDLPLTAELTIEKADFAGITFNDATVTYDGSAHSIAVANTPTGATITYVGNAQINAGTYTVRATVSQANYNDLVLTAELEITKAMLTDIALRNNSFVYDGNAKSLEISGILPTGVQVIYTGNNQVNAGMYTVVAEIADTQNHTGLRLEAQLQIDKAPQTITFTSPGMLGRDAGTVALDVRSDSGLPVSLSVDDDMVGRIEGLNLEILRLGTVTVTAIQPGNGNYEAAEPVSFSVRVANDATAAVPIRVHQAVSPNGDGINDFLMMEGILDYPENKVTIFDKSGKVIDVIESYNNRDRVFTGQFVNDGTYYYYIDVKDGGVWKREKGFFVVKRSVN
ncbi:T9SS type B sorting domain-containing protein [Sphingobacterium wenxiniae]|uniref:Gliding motility-associated C-terminal domain-containing protein n=1 Tax=Sphingobacterium wenxiniae TaxID=683125 RepID=A0A1I6Q2E8_9SPHI|nr:gliding motility-associated C-terminal domain-containing protein [Sphingobacterium wenxiniae]SFS46515.1 gliding motility-associated C-terminal domain-containing protein [Sphingobacterium wenxiniae]